MQFWTPEQAISLSLGVDPDQPLPEYLRTSYAERLRELQGAIEAKDELLTVRNGKVERFDFVFWASQREEWDIPRESPLYKIAADEPIREQGERRSARHAAEIHENRYRAVGEYAQRASFDVAELDAWAVANRVPGSFRTLLTPDNVGADLPSVRRFQPCSSLPALIASAFVPADMEPHEAREQLRAAGDTGEYQNAVNRLRDVIAERYGRLLLSAVYDGDLNLYDTLTFTKFDVTAARLRYEAAPDAYVQAVEARAMATHVSKMVELINNGEESIDWDYWVGKMPRWTAYQAVRLMAALDPAKHPDLSFKRKETAGAAKEHAQRLETLATSHRMNEVSPSEWLKWADELNEPVHDGFRAAVTLVADQREPTGPITEPGPLPPTVAVRTMIRQGDKWTDAELRTLLEEINQPGATQQQLAEKYGVKRQRISTLLKQAKDKFETRAKASWLPSSAGSRKVKGGKY
ncbi:hypothetical protein LFL97_09370 [Burkholderia sp. JSH-S8]|nr:hypothetical protein LFL97_09370 [Burkholderia sp. JSH-S8]